MDIKQTISRDINTAIKARERNTNVIFGFLGMPGIGKTAIIQQVCEELGVKYFGEMVLASCSPMDIMGKIPDVENEVLSSYPNDDMPLDFIVGDEPCVWFIDEVTNATSDTLKALQQGLLSRKFGKHSLGKNVIIILAGNRQSDKAGSGVLSTAIYNRVTWRNLEWDAKSSDIAVSYITDKYREDTPEAEEMIGLMMGYFAHVPMIEKDFTDALGKIGKEPFVQWCSPRSLEALVGRMAVNNWALPSITDMAGDIGMGRATELFGFAQLLGKLTKFEDLIKDPAKAKMPESIDAQYAMVGMLAARVKKDTFAPVWEYASRFNQITLKIVFLKMAMKVTPDIRNSPAYMRLYKESPELNAAIMGV